jgi:hypothetical protein
MLRQRHVSAGFGPFDVFSPKMDMNSENVILLFARVSLNSKTFQIR